MNNLLPQPSLLMLATTAMLVCAGCGGCDGGTHTTPQWNYVFYQADDNGFPLNPPWGYQIAAPFTSNCGERKYSPCTDQPLELNWDWGMCGMWGYDGHYNHRTITYEGLICWDSHSTGAGSDDDYNINIYRPDNAGFQPGSQHLGMEFDSDETIDHFHTRWWSLFHGAVDDSDSKAGAMINGKEAIVIGTLGLDCAHGCIPEIHPVMAMAIHVNDDPADDTWAMFARNWGDEGYCGNFVEEEPERDFTFRLPWRKGADEVSVSSATFLCRESDDTYSVEPRREQNTVLVTLSIGPFMNRDRMNGEIHLNWSGPNVEVKPSPWDWDELWRSWSAAVGQHPAWSVAPDTCMGAPTAPPFSEPGMSWMRSGQPTWRAPMERGAQNDSGDKEPEMVMSAAVRNMTSEQRAVVQHLLANNDDIDEVLVRESPARPDRGRRGKPSELPPRLERHFDARLQTKRIQWVNAIRSALGPELSAKLPLPPVDQIGRVPPEAHKR